MEKKRITLFTLIVYLSTLCMCMALNVTGPVLNDIMEHYSLPLSNGGLMSFFQYGGGAIAIIIASVLVNRSNKAIAFIIPLLILGITTLLIGTIPSFFIFMAMYLIMGMGLTMGDVLANALIPDLQYNNKNRALSLLHGVTGLGAIIIALVSGVVLDSGIKWNIVYIIVGIIMIALALINTANYGISGKYVKHLVVPVQAAKEKGALKMFLKDKRVWISMVVLVFFGSCQSTTIVWAPQYCRDVFNVSSLASNFSIIAYWGGTAIVRLLFGLTKLSKLDTKKVNIIGGISGGAVLLLGIFLHNYYILMAAIMIFGMLTAPILPLTISLTSSYHKEHSGLVSSAVFFAMYVAFAVMPLLAGIFASSLGMDAIFILASSCAILSGIMALLIIRPKEN